MHSAIHRPSRFFCINQPRYFAAKVIRRNAMMFANSIMCFHGYRHLTFTKSIHHPRIGEMRHDDVRIRIMSPYLSNHPFHATYGMRKIKSRILIIIYRKLDEQ